jgi:flagellar basal body-associated protein FliL
MAQSDKRENSVLFSLRELRSIEETRVKEEEDAAKMAEEARIRARMDEERRRADAEEAEKQRQLEAARLERETAEARVREEGLRIQETEARARAEHQANLEAQRLAHEMEIRKTEASKKRPVALVVAMLIFALVTVGAVLFMIQRSNEKEEADKKRAEAELRAEEDRKIREQKERETAELKATVDALIAAQKDLDNQMRESERQLAAATSQADRDKVAARQAEIRRQQREAQARLDKVKAGVKLKCPPDQPLC